MNEGIGLTCRLYRKVFFKLQYWLSKSEHVPDSVNKMIWEANCQVGERAI